MAHLPTPNDRTRRRRSSILNYEQSVVFGAYREDLAAFALTQAEKLAQLSEGRGKDEASEKHKDSLCLKVIRKIFKYGGDMIFFSVLATTLAILSFTMDIVVHAFFDRKPSSVK